MVWRWGKREIIYLSLHCHHRLYTYRYTVTTDYIPIATLSPQIIYLSLHCHYQNDSYIKMGSDESHFSVSLTVSDKVKLRHCRWPKPAQQPRQSIQLRKPSSTSLLLISHGLSGPICWSKPDFVVFQLLEKARLCYVLSVGEWPAFVE